MAPGDCLVHLDTALISQQDASMALTLFYGILNTESGDLQFSNGGHAIPYLYSEIGRARPLYEKAHAKYHNGTVKMKPGDGLLLYTDGVTEAPNLDRKWFGNDRMEEYVNLNAPEPVERMVLDLFTTLRYFCLGTAQADDITVMALRYRG